MSRRPGPVRSLRPDEVADYREQGVVRAEFPLVWARASSHQLAP